MNEKNYKLSATQADDEIAQVGGDMEIKRYWPLLSATQADDEIAQLRAMVSQLKADNKAMRSSIKSLTQAVAELQTLIRRIAHVDPGRH